MSHHRAEPPRSKTRPALALLLDFIEGDYQMAIARGVREAALDRDASVVCFCGGLLHSKDRASSARNKIYDLATLVDFDGVSVLGGTIALHSGSAAFSDFCQRFRPRPVVSIAAELASSSSVMVDNQAGMKATVQHLIKDHGKRRIAFIRGPKTNSEAELRYAAYTDVLAANNLALDQSLVVVGNFLTESGALAIQELLVHRKLASGSFDAVVAANDNMALGALAELQRRKIRVPGQVAVAGFDCAEEGLYASPTLTSVRQPREQIGRRAVQSLIEQVNGVGAQEHALVPAELVARRSCGCFGNADTGLAAGIGTARLGFEAALLQRRVIIGAELSRAARGNLGVLGTGWEDKLLNAFAMQVRRIPGDPFLSHIDDLLGRLRSEGKDLTIVHTVLASLRRQVIACCEGDFANYRLAEDAFHDANFLIASAKERLQAHARISVRNRVDALSQATSELLRDVDVERFAAILPETLRGLNIESAHVLLAQEPDNALGPARLLVSYDVSSQKERRETQFKPINAQLASILSGPRARAFVAEPLLANDRYVGCMLLDFSSHDGFIYTSVPALVGAALSAKNTKPT